MTEYTTSKPGQKVFFSPYTLTYIGGIFVLTLFALLSIVNNLRAQDLLSERREEVKLTKKTLDHIYNFEFEEADSTIRILESKMPEHPGLTLLNALLIFWKDFPLKEGGEAGSDYESFLDQTTERAESLLDQNENDVEGIFFTLAAYGFLTGYYAEEGSIFKALGYARKAYASLKAGFDLKDEYAEFYFSTGLYNYYREKYPENNIGYKSVAWIFQSGDKELGIKQLQTAAEKALFTSVEANYYLFHIYLRYESNPEAAIKYAKRLVSDYPDNLSFAAYYAESLLANNRFDEADPIARRLMKSDRGFYRLPGNLLHGVALEKSEGKQEEAIRHYNKVLELSEGANFDVDHYKSMAYLGLGRIDAARGKDKLAEEWYEKALKFAKYDIAINEAKEFLSR